MAHHGSYLGELRQHARPLAAACLGSGTSIALFAYTNSVFSPFLIKEFGWSRAQFALVGLTMFASLLTLPVIGRLTDRFGVRRVALFGALTVPLCFVGYAMQQGSFTYFLAVATAILICGSTTSTLTYTRLVAESFDRATGLALTVVNSVPAVLAIVLVPLLNHSIETIGWRYSYLCLGALTLVCGLGAVALIPPLKPQVASEEGGAAQPGARTLGPKPGDYRLILRSRVFWVIIIGMFFCLLQTPLHSAQMNIMLLDNGLTTQAAANIVSVYALGTIVGRLACGLALDRYSTRMVTWISMAIPAFGYLLLGTEINTIPMITFAMFLVGLSIGAESDLVSYLVARYFQIRIYNTTLSLLFSVSFLASASGAMAISLTLRLWDSFSPFLYLVAGAITLGSLLFLLLPRDRDFAKIG